MSEQVVIGFQRGEIMPPGIAVSLRIQRGGVLAVHHPILIALEIGDAVVQDVGQLAVRDVGGEVPRQPVVDRELAGGWIERHGTIASAQEGKLLIQQSGHDALERKDRRRLARQDGIVVAQGQARVQGIGVGFVAEHHVKVVEPAGGEHERQANPQLRPHRIERAVNAQPPGLFQHGLINGNQSIFVQRIQVHRDIPGVGLARLLDHAQIEVERVVHVVADALVKRVDGFEHPLDPALAQHRLRPTAPVGGDHGADPGVQRAVAAAHVGVAQAEFAGRPEQRGVAAGLRIDQLQPTRIIGRRQAALRRGILPLKRPLVGPPGEIADMPQGHVFIERIGGLNDVNAPAEQVGGDADDLHVNRIARVHHVEVGAVIEEEGDIAGAQARRAKRHAVERLVFVGHGHALGGQRVNGVGPTQINAHHPLGILGHRDQVRGQQVEPQVMVVGILDKQALELQALRGIGGGHKEQALAQIGIQVGEERVARPGIPHGAHARRHIGQRHLARPGGVNQHRALPLVVARPGGRLLINDADTLLAAHGGQVVLGQGQRVPDGQRGDNRGPLNREGHPDRGPVENGRRRGLRLVQRAQPRHLGERRGLTIGGQLRNPEAQLHRVEEPHAHFERVPVIAGLLGPEITQAVPEEIRAVGEVAVGARAVVGQHRAQRRGRLDHPSGLDVLEEPGIITIGDDHLIDIHRPRPLGRIGRVFHQDKRQRGGVLRLVGPVQVAAQGVGDRSDHQRVFLVRIISGGADIVLDVDLRVHARISAPRAAQRQPSLRGQIQLHFVGHRAVEIKDPRAVQGEQNPGAGWVKPVGVVIEPEQDGGLGIHVHRAGMTGQHILIRLGSPPQARFIHPAAEVSKRNRSAQAGPGKDGAQLHRIEHPAGVVRQHQAGIARRLAVHVETQFAFGIHGKPDMTPLMRQHGLGGKPLVGRDRSAALSDLRHAGQPVLDKERQVAVAAGGPHAHHPAIAADCGGLDPGFKSEADVIERILPFVGHHRGALNRHRSVAEELQAAGAVVKKAAVGRALEAGNDNFRWRRRPLVAVITHPRRPVDGRRHAFTRRQCRRIPPPDAQMSGVHRKHLRCQPGVLNRIAGRILVERGMIPVPPIARRVGNPRAGGWRTGNPEHPRPGIVVAAPRRAAPGKRAQFLADGPRADALIHQGRQLGHDAHGFKPDILPHRVLQRTQPRLERVQHPARHRGHGAGGFGEIGGAAAHGLRRLIRHHLGRHLLGDVHRPRRALPPGDQRAQLAVQVPGYVINIHFERPDDVELFLGLPENLQLPRRVGGPDGPNPAIARAEHVFVGENFVGPHAGGVHAAAGDVTEQRVGGIIRALGQQAVAHMHGERGTHRLQHVHHLESQQFAVGVDPLGPPRIRDQHPALHAGHGPQFAVLDEDARRRHRADVFVGDVGDVGRVLVRIGHLAVVVNLDFIIVAEAHARPGVLPFGPEQPHWTARQVRTDDVGLRKLVCGQRIGPHHHGHALIHGHKQVGVGVGQPLHREGIAVGGANPGHPPLGQQVGGLRRRRQRIPHPILCRQRHHAGTHTVLDREAVPLEYLPMLPPVGNPQPASPGREGRVSIPHRVGGSEGIRRAGQQLRHFILRPGRQHQAQGEQHADPQDRQSAAPAEWGVG